MSKYNFSHLDPIKNRKRDMCFNIFILILFIILTIIILVR